VTHVDGHGRQVRGRLDYNGLLLRGTLRPRVLRRLVALSAPAAGSHWRNLCPAHDNVIIVIVIIVIKQGIAHSRRFLRSSKRSSRPHRRSL
jgi:hypothetical protein